MTAEPSTSERLVQSAMAEFRDHGFAGTDTNKIARRAGFAPQTFYRWFKDKTEVFVAAYRAWEDEERATLRDLTRQGARLEALVDAIIAQHRSHRKFRRSLRSLSLEVDDMRLARAQSRARQAERIERASSGVPLPRADIVVRLLQIERLADAVAEEELADMGLDDAVARGRIGQILAELGGTDTLPASVE